MKGNDLLNKRISLCSYKDYAQTVRSTPTGTTQVRFDLITVSHLVRSRQATERLHKDFLVFFGMELLFIVIISCVNLYFANCT